jgi:hypothetical protein
MIKWVRVNARLADDVQVRRFAVALLPSLPARAAVCATEGLLVNLWGQLAESAPSGDVSGCDDDQIEAWARWWGEPGAFASAWRGEFTSRGHVQDWEDYNGAALRRLSEDADRKRRKRGGKASAQTSMDLGEDAPQDNPAERPQSVQRTVRRTSAVNGNGDGNGQLKAGRVVTEQIPAREDAEVAATAAPNDQPTDRVVRTAGGEVTFPAQATALLERFYPKNPARMADAAKQLLAALGPGAVVKKGDFARAVDSAHLAWACQEVLKAPPDDEELAALWVLKKLQDTFEDVSARREREVRTREEAAKQHRVDEAQQYVDAIGGLWDKLEAEVDALLPFDLQGKPSVARNILLESALLDAFERQRQLDDDAPFKPPRPEPPGQKPAPPALPAAIPPELLEDGE